MMLEANKNILFIDIEAGFGGSSRSLYYLIRNLPNDYRSIVILGKKGPMIEIYNRMGVPIHIFNRIPRTTARKNKNIRSVLDMFSKARYLPRFILLIKNLIKKYDISIIHLNHESLFFVGLIMKTMFRIKMICHVRTMIFNNILGKIQVYLSSVISDRIIFITENNEKHWLDIRPKIRYQKNAVIYNIAEGKDSKDCAHEIAKSIKDKFAIISLSNLSHHRGVDRLVNVALELKRRDDHKIIFVICGRSVDSPYYLIKMKEAINESNIDNYFIFLGHQKEPERILAMCNALIRLHRWNNPWGRDIMESLTYGKPVITIGRYDKFVENGVNGYLLPEFNAEKIAEKIIYLSKHPEVVERMRKANIEKAKRLFDGPTNAAKVAAIYDSLIKS